MCCVGPSGRREGDKVMTEVDEGTNVLPVVEVVVLSVPNTGRGKGETEEEMGRGKG